VLGQGADRRATASTRKPANCGTAERALASPVGWTRIWPATPEEVRGPHGVPGGIRPCPFATGQMEPPDPTERGFKDTTKVNPGYFTIIRAKFDPPAGVTHPRPTSTTARSSNTKTTT
jgi:hypothetical protein